MISGKIATSASHQSSTILFEEEDTPSDAYSALTDAVLNAQSYPEYSQIDIDNLPNGSVIGEAEYDEEENEVVSLELYDWVLNEYGFEA